MPIKILLADDHKIVRDGIRSLLMDENDIKILSEANDGKEVIKKLKTIPIDLVVMDVNMPEMNGIECTKKITADFPNVKVLALTMLNENQHIRNMIEAGAQGYILKNSGKEELLDAIFAVNEGQTYFSKETSESIMQNLVQNKDRTKDRKSIPLTEREIEVLKLIIKEYTNHEIANELFISIRTVDAHRRNLLEKTGARNAAGLVKYAYESNLIF